MFLYLNISVKENILNLLKKTIQNENFDLMYFYSRVPSLLKFITWKVRKKRSTLYIWVPLLKKTGFSVWIKYTLV